MPFSIELFFDPKSSMAIRQMGTLLEKAGIPSIFSTLGATPHVSLAVFERYHPERLHALLKKLASSFSPSIFRLSSIGTFPGKEGVLFLAPAATASLLEIHSWLHRVLPKLIGSPWAYYDPSQWVPHCTLCLHLEPGKLARGLQLLLRKNLPVQGCYSQLALVETHPVHIKPIRLVYSIPLSGKKTKTIGRLLKKQ